MQFFGNTPARVYDQNGVVTQQAAFLILHEQIRRLLPNLSAVQVQKYGTDLEDNLDTFVRWLQARTPHWRGRAPGKENAPPPGNTGRGIRYRRSGYRLPNNHKL